MRIRRRDKSPTPAQTDQRHSPASTDRPTSTDPVRRLSPDPEQGANGTPPMPQPLEEKAFPDQADTPPEPAPPSPATVSPPMAEEPVVTVPAVVEAVREAESGPETAHAEFVSEEV